MVGKRLKPGDPEVVAYVVDRIRKMTREELLGRFRRREDFDEAWVRFLGDTGKSAVLPGRKLRFRKHPPR